MKDFLCPCCPTCGQETTGPIEVDRLKFILTESQFEIFRIVARRPGISTPELTDALYCNRWDGGPDTGDAAVRMAITRANRALKAAGLKIESSHRGPGAWWQIKRLEQVAP